MNSPINNLIEPFLVSIVTLMVTIVVALSIELIGGQAPGQVEVKTEAGEIIQVQTLKFKGEN